MIVVMHPRVDMSRHYLIPALLRAGHAVYAQQARDSGNDLRLVHEQALLDLGAGLHLAAHARLPADRRPGQLRRRRVVHLLRAAVAARAGEPDLADAGRSAGQARGRHAADARRPRLRRAAPRPGHAAGPLHRSVRDRREQSVLGRAVARPVRRAQRVPARSRKLRLCPGIRHPVPGRPARPGRADRRRGPRSRGGGGRGEGEGQGGHGHRGRPAHGPGPPG